MDARYFTNQYKLKAQIVTLDDGRVCLHRYSYPSKTMNNEHFDGRIFGTFEEAKAELDRIYTDDSAMNEVSMKEFLKAFEIEETPDAPYVTFPIKSKTVTVGVAYNNTLYYIDFCTDGKTFAAWISSSESVAIKTFVTGQKVSKHLSRKEDMDEFMKMVLWNLPDYIETHEDTLARLDESYERED